MTTPFPTGIRNVFSGLGALFNPIVPRRWRVGVPVVPVVRLSGVIGFSTPLRPGLTLAGTANLLDKAFKMRGAKAVALVINSPGGSAAQSHLIHARIRSLAVEKKLPVIAFVEDVAASGGYMIACAADEIVCDPSSIVGSIGVVGASFGFDEAIKKLGIQRRVYTAGEHKVMLDPFQPEKPEEVARLLAIQQQIHGNFIDLVKASRGSRLTGPEKTLFSGEYWVASTALGYGLIDRMGEVRSVLRERYGEDVLMPLVATARGLFGRLFPATDNPDLGMRSGVADEVVSAIEARALWARFGL
ncbi:MAG TPA: S49 family peptidase [Xanthobacteraceae bacterium]|nr:S49 family peptidase [Xanthobacteraceae bacterium]